MSVSAPLAVIMRRTWRLPATTPKLTSGLTFFPFSSAAVRHQVLVGRVGATADQHLVDLDPRHLPDFFYVVRRVRQRHIRLDGAEVKVDDAIVVGIGIGFQLHPVLLAPLRPEELARDLIAGENRGGHAELRAHVGDGGSFGNREAGNARAAVLDDRADVALGSQSTSATQG